MSKQTIKYGYKILNIEAGSLYAYNNGARDRYDYKKAMLTNSLFLDFLLENGLKSYKETYTRDVIGINFSYGSRSYEEEMAHLEKTRKKYADLEAEDSLERIDGLINFAKENSEKFIKKSKEEIREIFYRDGVNITYNTYDKKGNIKKSETLHYKMLYRTSNKAKKGSCIFICDRLYKKALNFLRMGIKLPKHNAKIVEISAYAPLVTSTIVDRIKINPKNILVIKDIDSFTKSNVISVETDENKHCVAMEKKDYELKNTLFDGQALIDSSIFPAWGNGYILLRHHFFKAAAFNTNIQLFFKDYFGDGYQDAKVVDMWGNEHYVKDIELITTDNALKWLKFDVTYEQWCEKVYENNCMFGIVKTAHKSKLDEVQRMSYQMVNALDIDIMPNVTQKSIEYIDKLKTDDDVFLDYLRKNDNFSNDFAVLVALVENNREFLRSEYFRDRKKEIIRAYVTNYRMGHILQNGDNLVIVGSPYAMLLVAVGENAENDISFEVEDDCIQCYTERFGSWDYLAEFRSPFNAKNNMGCLHNVRSHIFCRYFNFGEQIIAINMIHTDFQDRNNGSDQDSDSIYVTDQKDIVDYAKYCYNNFPTIVNNIPKENKSYDNDLLLYAQMDNNLASAQLAIGESSNLAQLALTYSYNFSDKKYQDYVCILSVLAQVAIDNAKRRFDIDLVNEIKWIKKDMNIREYKYPEFWGIVKKDFNRANINYSLVCPMNYLATIKVPKYQSTDTTLPMSDFFVKYEPNESRRRCKKVEDLIEKYSLNLYRSDYENDNNDFLIMQEKFDELIDDIRQIYISKNYVGLMSWLIDRAFCITNYQIAKQRKGITNSQLNQNKSILLSVLYKINPHMFLSIFAKNLEK